MRKRLFALGLLCLAGAPSFVSAANVQTDSWDILVTEDGDQRLIFSIEPIQMSTSDAGSDTTSGNDASDDTSDNDSDSDADDTSGNDTVNHQPMSGVPGEIFINEFVSDPVSGEDEWVELYNPEGRAVDLSGWTIREGSGRTTELEGFLGPDAYHVRYEISGSLNNGGDLIELVDPFGTVIDTLSYGSWENAEQDAASDPESLGRAQDRSSALAFMSPTPGEANDYPDVSAANTDQDTGNDDSESDANSSDNTSEDHSNTNDDTYDSDLLDDSDTDGHTACTPGDAEDTSDNAQEEDISSISLANIRTLPIGTRLTTEGVVSVLPGVLGSQYFYLAGSGVQVYLYGADFPALERGSRVRVTGELREVSGETRVKLDDASDIEVLSLSSAPEPHDISGGQVGESTEGWLVRLTGEVTDKSSGEFMLTDQEADVRVVIKDATGITADYEIGDTLTVTGIVSQTRSGYRLLPRDQADIVPRTEDNSVSAEDALNGVAGALTAGGSGSGGGWAVSALSVLAFAGAGVRYMYAQKKWLFA